MQVFVLLYNVGTENEGIHTLKLKEGDRNVVLMFESEDDAMRYGVMLEAQDFMTPVVESLDSEDIEAFCQDASYEWVLVPEGTLAIPPEANVEQTDWTPEATEASAGDRPAEFSESELEQMRRRLEGLL